MRRDLVALSAWLMAVALAPSAARAEAADQGPPALPAYAGLGAFTGGSIALTVGTLVLRRDGWQSGDGRSLGYATGAGLLSGAALGLAVAAADRNLGAPRRPPYYGFNLLLVSSAVLATGAVLGCAYFFVDTLFEASGSRQDQPPPPDHRRLPRDMAVGALGGLGLTLVLGAGAALFGRGGGSPPPAVSLTLAEAKTARGTAWLPTLAGRY
jgi:hypothetical protein